VLELFQRGVEQVALQKARSNSNITTMRKALAIMLDGARTDGLHRRVRDEANVSLAQVKRLEDAIIAVARNLTITFNTPSDANYFLNQKAEVKAITGTPPFRNILTQARARFSGTSVIDIRGCRAGASLDYLKAIANFFGSNSTKPKVTGPDFYQSFPT